MGGGAPTHTPSRAEAHSSAAAWYGPVLAGVTPVLIVGLGASAVANRLAFAAWALVVAVAYASLRRAAWDLGWERRVATGAGLLTLALGSVAFAALVERHGEILDLGARAVLPALHHPWLTHPAIYWALAACLAVVGALRLTVAPRAGRGPRRPAHPPEESSP